MESSIRAQVMINLAHRMPPVGKKRLVERLASCEKTARLTAVYLVQGVFHKG